MEDGQFIILHPYIPQNPIPGSNTTSDGLNPTTWIINQENTL